MRRRRGRRRLWRRRRGYARPYRGALRARRGRPSGAARGAAAIAQPRRARPRPRDARLHGPPPARLRLRQPARPVGLWRRDLARQGHALRPLGDRGHPGGFRVGLFSADDAGLSRISDARADRGRAAAGHSRRLSRLGHGDHRRIRRGASAHAEADLLHVRRFRAADRRARRGVRPGAALRSLPDRAPALRSLEHRPRDRPALRRQDVGRFHPHVEPEGFLDAAAARQPASHAPRARAARSSRSARSATSSRIATPDAN